MGWSAGAGLGQEIYDEVREYIPVEKRKEVARFIYDSVCDLDADDWDLSSQLEIDAGISAEWIEENGEDDLDEELVRLIKEAENGEG